MKLCLRASAVLPMLMALVWVLLPAFAYAQVSTAGFSCSGGHATGSLYDAGAGVCPTTMKFSNVFSFLLCHTEQISANLLGSMYCGVMSALQPAVTATVTLAVLFAGTGFMIGFTNITGKDFLALLLKIAAVYAFATDADLIIGIGYNLLVSGLREGTAVAISSLYRANGSLAPDTALGVYALMDGFLAQALHFATDAIGQTWDQEHNPCQNAIFAVMAIMAIAFPPIFYIGLMMIARIAMTFLRAVFGYMYSVVGITFLLTLSPFFLSFMLFKQTQSLFEKWLGYLVSFSLQLVIVFAFLSFILSIRIDHVTNSLTDVIMPTAQNYESTTIRMPWQYCTVCEFDVVDKDSGAVLASDSGDFLSRGKLQCREPKKPLPVMQQLTPPSENAGGAGGGGAPSGGGNTAFQNTLMKFATTGLLSLLVLAFVVDALLGSIPAMAQYLASNLGNAMYAPQMVGGDVGQAPAMGIPGEGVINTLQRGFTDGFRNQTNAVSGAIEGFRNSVQRMVIGGGRSGDANPQDNSPGIVGHFMRFMINPQRGPIDPHNPE